MLIAAVLCLCAATVSAALGLWSLSRPRDTARTLLRAVAPTQLAAAAILAAGGLVALAAPPSLAVPVVIVCVAGAVGAVAAGSWQTARYAVSRDTAPADCRGNCPTCTLSCR